MPADAALPGFADLQRPLPPLSPRPDVVLELGLYGIYRVVRLERDGAP
jgi:hypothetical protein